MARTAEYTRQELSRTRKALDELRRSGRAVLEALVRGGPELEALRRSAAAQLEREHVRERKHNRGFGR